VSGKQVSSDLGSVDMTQASIIVAMTPNRVIGRAGTLPWHLSDDLKRFKQITMGNSLIMGRKTYDSIGHPLPGRTNIIVSRQANLEIPGAIVVHRFQDAIREVPPGQDAFAVGGESIYLEALPTADQLFVTWVHADIRGDTFFPPIDLDAWRVLEQTERAADERNEFDVTFQRLVRREP
jgi:dihydrofolate reductase